MRDTSTSRVRTGTARGFRRRPAVLTRQQARTLATRRKLLAAAERVFARDGFEAARLEDIAGEAGYTRGAFYANFGGKEDIFFALLEKWVEERMESIKFIVNQDTPPRDKLAALRAFYAGHAADRHVSLLSLEFKLFALRHPRARARLRARLHRIRALAGHLMRGPAKASGRTMPVQDLTAAATLGVLPSALLIEHLVDPDSISEQDVRRLLELFFDLIVGGGSRR